MTTGRINQVVIFYVRNYPNEVGDGEGLGGRSHTYWGTAAAAFYCCGCCCRSVESLQPRSLISHLFFYYFQNQTFSSKPRAPLKMARQGVWQAGDIIPRAWIGMCQGATKDGEAGVWPLNNCGDIIPRAWHVGCVGRSLLLQVRECSRHCYQQTYRAGNGESQPATDSSGGGFDTTNHRHRCLRPLLALLLHCAYRAVNNTVNDCKFCCSDEMASH